MKHNAKVTNAEFHLELGSYHTRDPSGGTSARAGQGRFRIVDYDAIQYCGRVSSLITDLGHFLWYRGYMNASFDEFHPPFSVPLPSLPSDLRGLWRAHN